MTAENINVLWWRSLQSLPSLLGCRGSSIEAFLASDVARLDVKLADSMYSAGLQSYIVWSL